MESKLHGLPPLKKRLRLLHQQKQQQQQPQPEYETESEYESECILPAKKRKQSRQASSKSKSKSSESIPPTILTPTTFFTLPAKKRVWAILPHFSPTKSPTIPTSFDLNVEYTPSPQKHTLQTILESQLECPDPDLPSPQNPNTDVQQPTECFSKEEAKADEDEDEDEDDGIVCAVCDSTDGDPSDPIVFCDGCDLMVHASCYGNPLVKGIPQGDWFCAHCCVSKSSFSSHECCLCPAKGGAMKPTTHGKWAHLICALFVPEVFFLDPQGREGINCDNIPNKRWSQICYVCNKTKGCVVDCSEPKCPLSFHVSCGLKEDLCIELKEGKYTPGVVTAFCKDHTLLWTKQQQTGKFRIVPRED